MPRLPPDERRAALIAATLPLLRAHGLDVSTRQIADAAGVAEGTIFRVFPDKAALFRAAITHALDPEPVIDGLRHLHTYQDLRIRLLVATRILARRLGDSMPLLMTMRASGLVTVEAHRNLERLHAALAELVEPDQPSLRYPADTVARLLFSLVMMRYRANEKSLADKDIVSIVLDGVMNAHQAAAPPPGALSSADPGDRVAATHPDAGNALPPYA